MSKNQSLSLRTQWLGRRLRAARQAANFTLKEAAQQLQLVDTTLSRFEKGTIRIRRPYVTEMIDYYGISNHLERDALIRLNEDAWRKDWWDGDTSDLEIGFIDLAWLERRALTIRAFEPLMIHGLLQAPEYANALRKVGYGNSTSEPNTRRISEIRTTRQEIFQGENPTGLKVVLEEPALYRMVGGPKVHKKQLAYLIERSNQANIDIRVLSRKPRWDPGHHGPFMYFEMPDPYPEVAYIENLAGKTFLEDEAKVDRFRRTYDELESMALNPQESRKFIQGVLKDLQ